MPEAVQMQLSRLASTQRVALGEALLDFTELADLEQWLATNAAH